jgi:hypothetical protein
MDVVANLQCNKVDKEDADIIKYMPHRYNSSQHRTVMLTTKATLPKDIVMTITVGAMAMTCLIGITQELVQSLFKGMYVHPHDRIFVEVAQGQHIR